MDYLTVLATRSLILFSPSKPSQPNSKPLTFSYSPKTPPSEPTTPTTTSTRLPYLSPTSSEHLPSFTLLPPQPIALPLQSLAWSDTDNECAYFLLSHLLATSIPAQHSGSPGGSPANGFGISPGSLGALEKRMANEAEAIVWKEINKGKAFVRAIGEWFGGSMEGKIDAGKLKMLAEACGVVLKEEEADEEEDYEHIHAHIHEMEHDNDNSFEADAAERMSIDLMSERERERRSVNDISMSGHSHSMIMA